jgi:hypothetical protein
MKSKSCRGVEFVVVVPQNSFCVGPTTHLADLTLASMVDAKVETTRDFVPQTC